MGMIVKIIINQQKQQIAIPRETVEIFMESLFERILPFNHLDRIHPQIQKEKALLGPLVR